MVSLRQELDFVAHYVSLQKSRFEDGLQINIDVETDYLLYRIVPVTLQNLFENAIKHNIVSSEKPLLIDISTDSDGYIFVKNN